MPGAERDEQHVLHARRRAVRDLAERRDVGVVVDDERVLASPRRSASRSGASRTVGRFGE